MKQQEQLRNTLREYYDNQEVPFDDNEWERASAYLDAARRRNKIRYSAIVVGAIVAVLFIFLFHSSEATSHEKLLSDQKLKPGSASQKTEAQISPDKKTNTHVTSKMIFQPETRSSTRSMPAGLSFSKTAQIVETKAALPEQDFTGQKNAVKEVLATENTPVMSPATDAAFMANNNTAERDIKYEVPKENKEPASVPLEIPTSSQNQFQAKEIQQVPVNVLPQTAEIVALNNNKKEAAGIDTTKFASPEKIVVPAIVNTAQRELITGIAPTMEPATVDTLPDSTSLNNLAGEGVFYEVGGAWLYGWKGPVHRDARGLSPVVGIHYMNRLGRRCALSFGLQYLQVRNLSNSSKTSRVSSYVYGEQSSVTVITPSSAYYLLAPLRFHYYVDHRNSFGVGINLAYLLNVDATVTSHEEGPGFAGNYKTVKLGGYSQGFSWFDSQLAFCYRRRISNSFGLQAEIFMGLIEVKQDEFFGFKNKERNSGAKLSLVYHVFRKKGR